MSMRSLRHLVPVLMVTLLGVSEPASAKRVDGVFTAIKDANVVVLDYGDGAYDVRLYGTEAPAEGQPFAAEARAFVREALLGKPGAMRFKYRNKKDQMVARIFYLDADGRERDLGTDLAAAGLVWLRPGARYRPEVEGQPDQLTAAQAEAQSAGRGIWATAKPVAPWTFRGETLPAEGGTSGVAEGVAGTPDINISQRVGSDNECAIAKNPANPLQLVAHCNSLATPWRSTDGGQTWVVGGTIGSYCCDPNLAFDSFGNLFATYLNGGVTAVVTKLSVDGGATYTPLASFSGGVDQPSVVAHDGMVWIVWKQGSDIVARGAAVTGLGAVGAFTALQTAASTSGCSFGDLATSPVGPGFAVVQVCGPQNGEGPGSIRINVDADGLGAGVFGPSIVAATTNVGGFDKIPPQPSRSVDTEAGLAFDRNPSSPYFGRLFLVYTEEVVDEQNDTEIMLKWSDNTGATWLGPVRVNDDATTRSQFLPKIASDPATGNIAICWHDARNSASNTAMEEWCASVAPAAVPAPGVNVRVSDGASVSTDSGMDFGDYSGLTLVAGTAHAIWADSSNSTGNNPDGTGEFDTYTDKHSVLAADYTLGATPPTQSICAPADATFNINVGGYGGYVDPVTLAASGQPAGTTTGFSVNPVTPAGASVLTIGNTGAAASGTSTITVQAASTTGPKAVQLTLNLSVGLPAAASLSSPPDTSVGVTTQPTLVWAAVPSATSYFVEVSEDATFTTVDYSATVPGTSHQVSSSLAPSTLYYWRVTATNGCGSTPGTSWSFTTANILTACGGPITINDSTVAAPYPSVATAALGAGAIVSIDLSLAGFTHTFPDDVDMLLVSPSGQKLIFMSDAGGSGPVSGLNLGLADSASTLLPDAGPLVAGSFRPSNVTTGDAFAAPAPAAPYDSAAPAGAATFLSTFGAGAVNGNWKLYIVDDAGSDIGTLTQWCVNIMLSGSMPFQDGFESNSTSTWSATAP